MITAHHMLDIEKQHLDPSVRSSTERLGALLCDDFLEFGASGKIYDRTQVLMSVTGNCEVADYKIDDYQISQLGENHILASYKLSERYGDQQRLTLRSTVWRLVGTHWRILFHQGTQQAE